ncbi:hypothetical protein JHK82_022261 [Glycine max]|uniref:Uncharacterized protein n=1 Tax=Glycine max TaxID=3847 RepID=A0A0R0IWW8_SOYBN|nr:hypothetical protein JHK85_022751 [Glycine max]KAG5026374.1 hypothetical protein JHK86_022288 [Glycine max]KAG5137530.1 hypothetical protein JHK82_022261 [Glycine max]KAH1052821.1 hypothetical protein GYH30_022222 [Glycine max]
MKEISGPMSKEKEDYKGSFRNQAYFSFTPYLLHIYDIENDYNWTKLQVGLVQEQNFTLKLLITRISTCWFGSLINVIRNSGNKYNFQNQLEFQLHVLLPSPTINVHHQKIKEQFRPAKMFV